ncbi:hypothetical protein [Anaerospora sp.]|uniref:hypothetical protein n=1 Tax=Anaerospora sp. TaxID=1960278 RepID=UPI00289A28E5|nr:hypothetical protein [Anaerospora sp.]
MKMLIRRTTDNSFEGVFSKLNFKDNNLTITIIKRSKHLDNRSSAQGSELSESYNNEILADKTFDLAKLFKPRTFFYCYMSGDIPRITDFFDTQYSNKSREELYRSIIFELMGVPPYVGVYFHNSIDEMFLIANQPIDEEVLDNKYAELIKDNITLFDYLCTNVDGFISVNEEQNAKKKVLMELNPNTSLAALEAQVDLLTELVFSMLKNQPNLIRTVQNDIPYLSSFEQVFTDTSLLAIKDAKKCLNEIKETKAKIRQVQMDYYNEKSRVLNDA